MRPDTFDLAYTAADARAEAQRHAEAEACLAAEHAARDRYEAEAHAAWSSLRRHVQSGVEARQAKRDERRAWIKADLAREGRKPPYAGVAIAYASHFGVDETTIRRDLDALRKAAGAPAKRRKRAH